MPAPEPPYSSGMHSPSRPASRNAAKTSSGYLPVSSISRARGRTLSLGEAAHRVAKRGHLFGEVEIHPGRLARTAQRLPRPESRVQADLRRWRTIRRRSRSVSPPQTPSRSRAASAYSMQDWRTTHVAQMALASSAASSETG